MRPSTTVRETRDALRSLADDDGVKLDEEINRRVRAERQRRMWLALSTLPLDDEDQSCFDAGAEAFRDDARR